MASFVIPVTIFLVLHEIVLSWETSCVAIAGCERAVVDFRAVYFTGVAG
jgi:hypothetical protein